MLHAIVQDTGYQKLIRETLQPRGECSREDAAIIEELMRSAVGGTLDHLPRPFFKMLAIECAAALPSLRDLYQVATPTHKISVETLESKVIADDGTLRTARLTVWEANPEAKDNPRRVLAAQKTVAAYRKIKGYTEEQLEECSELSDLLTDLMHWADALGYDFDAALSHAQDNHAQEQLAARAAGKE